MNFRYMSMLLCDSGATKAEWCHVSGKMRHTVFTQGISPYFMDDCQMSAVLQSELIPALGKRRPVEVFYYGTGCAAPENARLIKRVLKNIFPAASIMVSHDLMAAARALCGRRKGIACILGTGSNSCYFNGRKIVRNSPGLGYVLGDEGSGAYLGKKVLQYYLYGTFDEDLRSRFDLAYTTHKAEILENVYKKPLPNRYLAGYTGFLAKNRGHYMIENIIEDGLNDFFFQHLCKYPEAHKYPVHFTGGVSFGFRDVLLQLCHTYGFEPGNILKNPMEGLLAYHR